MSVKPVGILGDIKAVNVYHHPVRAIMLYLHFIFSIVLVLYFPKVLLISPIFDVKSNLAEFWNSRNANGFSRLTSWRYVIDVIPT